MKRPALKPEIKFGAEPKKVLLLAGLLAVLVVVWLLNRGDSSPAPSAGTATPAPQAAVPAAGARTPVRTVSRTVSKAAAGGRGLSIQEFRPTLKPKDPIDTSRVDPTLRMELLAKLRNTKLEGGSRSLFEFSGAPAPSTQAIAKVGPIVPKPLQGALTTGPVKPAPPAPPPQPPPPPAIPLKFYGYTNAQRSGPRRAFFLEGEDIYVAGEGETIKSRYKIIRIGVNSAVVEDTQNKNQQTLPLIEELANS